MEGYKGISKEDILSLFNLGPRFSVRWCQLRGEFRSLSGKGPYKSSEGALSTGASAADVLLCKGPPNAKTTELKNRLSRELWVPHPWKLSRPGWMGPWAA